MNRSLPRSGPTERGLTYRDLAQTPEDGRRYEVIDGELCASPFPGYPHQKAATRLTTMLDQHVTARRLGEVFAANLMVVLDEPTGVGPDIVYVSAANMTAMADDGFHGIPDLLVEVTSSRPQWDSVIKLRKYERAGVPHCWVLDPAARTLSAYRLEGRTYAAPIVRAGDEVFEPSLFPGLRIPLGELWVR